MRPRTGAMVTIGWEDLSAMLRPALIRLQIQTWWRNNPPWKNALHTCAAPGISRPASPLSSDRPGARPRADFPPAHLDGLGPISDNPPLLLRPKWRNWQTHWFQVPAPVRVSGFNSRLRHHPFSTVAISKTYKKAGERCAISVFKQAHRIVELSQR